MPKLAPDPKPQIDKFRELARELETDDDEAAFDERLKKLVGSHTPRQKPCRDCAGSGKMPKLIDNLPAVTPPKPEWETCRACGGSGIAPQERS